MWKAAFTGRSESGGGSAAGRPSKDEPRRKKSSHSHRAESVISSTSRRDEDKDRERRRRDKSGSVYDNASSASRYENGSSYTSGGGSQYATAPSSRVGEPRPLTESALRMLPDDEEEWEDDEKDARSEKRSRRKESGDEKRRKSTRSEKERSRSRSRERRDKKRESKSDKSREKERERASRRDPELVSERAIPEMGSFAQFPGQYGPASQEPAMMSGALPSPVPDQQFPAGLTRADSFGAAAEYYLDEGQSVHHQPGVRPLTPNMLVNPDLDHLMAASAQPNPAQDTGNGSAADFFSGKVSPVPYETPQKPTKPGKQSSFGSSKPSKPSRISSAGVAALAGTAAAAMSSSHSHSQSQQQTTTSSSKPISRPQRHSSDGGVYYAQPSSHGTYPPTLPSTNGYGPSTPSHTGNPGKRPTNDSNVPLYAGAAAAGAAGFAAYEYNKHSQNNSQYNATYNMSAGGGYGGGGQGPPRSPRLGAGGSGYYPPNGSNGGMAQMPYHEHKGPMTRLKDGLLNLIASPEDTAKMEMYTEYIGVCKHCFDPRTSAWDAPRVHHYHKRRDSFEDLRRRRSYDKMRRRGSDESLRRQGSTRVDKENRYYASESSRKKRESGGAGILGAGLAAAGAAGVANAMFSDRKDFDDTYSVKSGHRESSAVRRRSRSSSREQRRRSTHGTVRPDRDEYVTVRKKDGTVERRKVSRKSRSSSRDRKSSGLFGAAATGAALGAAGMAASSRRHSRSPSPSVLGGSDSRSKRRGRRSPDRTSYGRSSRHDERPQESEGFFGGFFSPPRKGRRDSREHQKKRRGFFTFSNSSESSHDDLAFGEGFSSRTSLPLRRKSSTMSNRSGRNGRRTSRKKSDEHLAATVAGIGATAAALAAAQKGHRISKRTSRPELGKRREPRYETHDSTDDDWEDELPSDVDDESSVDGGLAFGDYGNKRLSSRQSMESVGSQSSAGGPLSAWGWRWGNKEQKRRGRRTSSPRQSYGSFVAPGLSVAGSVSGASYDPSRPINKPVYLDDTGRPLPSISSESTTTSGPQGPLQFVDPAPMSDAGSRAGSRHPSMPGAFDDEPPIIRPGPGPIQQPQPIAPIQPSFTQSPPDIRTRPDHPRRANSSPTRGHFAQDAALIGAAALGTAGIIAGSSMASGRRSREPSNVRFGLTEEQERKDERDQRKQQKLADEERRKADRTRALKEEADRAAKESRQEEIRQAREDENRRRAEERIREQREAEERAERQRQKEQARIERERLEKEAQDRKDAAAAAAAEVERLRLEREEAQRQTERYERERQEREEAQAREQRRLADERERFAREQDSKDRYNRERRDNDERQSSASKWAPVAVGAAAAATVGAAIASEKGRDRKRRDDSYYDEAHSSRQSRRDYGTEEVKPKYEHEGEPIMDDDIFDPELFKRKQRDSSAQEELENDPRYVEFARRAADKIAADRERAYSPAGSDKYTTYADFFMPEELLNKTAEPGSKVRDVSPNADNEIAVWHARDDEIRRHMPQHASDYGYGRSKHAPYGVPKLNVISPTPPLESQSPTSVRSSKGSKPSSPLARTKDRDEDEVPEEMTTSQMSEKSERSRSISWGEDKTHFYDVDTPTPESHMDRDSYITSPDMRGQAERVAAGVAGAAAAGAALHDIVVEEPSGESHRYSEEEWLREETKGKPRSSRKPTNDDDDVEDITPSPEPEPGFQGFYRQPFFDSVSDMGTGIFNMDSPGTEGAPPTQGWVEGEVDETPADEKAPHIPGGFDDEEDPVSAEIKKEQTAQAEAGAAREAEQPAWEPPLSKKEKKKKREKAAKRTGSIAESDPPTPVTETPASNGDARDEATGNEEYFPPLSKKDKKKLEKEAKKQGVGFADLVSQLQSEKQQSPESPQEARREEPVDEWEPPLSKKEQKKRDKEAKKQGFADVADEILAAGGIAAAAAAATGAASAAMDSTEESAGGSTSSKKKKKGKKAKLGEPLDSDPRDLELSKEVPPAVPEVPTFTEEPSGMPGAWDDERRDSTDQSSVDAKVDPFQYQVRDPETTSQERPDAKEVDSWAEWSEPATSKKSKKDKKKGKRGSVAFDTLPEVSSPLRAEVPQDDYMGKSEPLEAASETVSNGTAAYINGSSSKALDSEVDDRSGRSTDFFETKDRVSESPRQVSPDDVRSFISAPEERRKSKRDEARRGSDYTDEPSYAYETQSVAASEPADIYDRDRKSSKRRSKHADDFDDTASVTSSRSRREKEESPSSSKKESKGGLFGLFSRKSVDEKSSKDGSQLSRKSTRDEEEESRRRRKHRSTSEYGDDDDDTRSVKSESRRRHRSHSEHGDEESRERRKRSSRDQSYDEYSRDRSSPARSEPSSGHRHHHRRRTDDDGEDLSRKDSRESRGAVSESGHRHHRRRRTDEDYDSKDQSFLGNRVEGLPPLPASPEDSDSAAAQESSVPQEQGEGSPVSAESAHQASVNDGKDARDLVEQDLLQTPAQKASSLETPQRPASLGRPASSTTVPLRFPFGHVPPQTPASLKERAHSFSSPLATPGAATSSPISPSSTNKQSRQGRPHSNEFRPLYLVERNRQTPEVDEGLPSLPSSKPSSRASSIHGSDENYQSAAEDWAGAESPSRRRALTVDIGEAQRWKDDGDVLDSQQTTPKASEFPQLPGERQHPKQEPQFYTWEDLAREEQPKEQPQFYTWDDFARDEKMHEDQSQPQADPEAAYRARVSEHEELPPLPRSRSVSPAQKDDHGHGTSFKSVAAAAMLGTAAVYAGHKLSERSSERSPSRERNDRRGSYEPATKDEAASYPLPAPVDESPRAEEKMEEVSRPEISRKGSSKKKKGKKGKKSQQIDDEPETPATPLSEVEQVASTADRSLERQDTDTFFDAEAQAEAGAMESQQVPETFASAREIHRSDTDIFLREEVDAEEGVSHPHLEDPDAPVVPLRENALDRFLHEEKDMEEGAVFASAAAHTMPVLPTHSDEPTQRLSAEEHRMEDGGEPRASVETQEERPSTSYKIPEAKAEPAPLVVDQRSVVVDHEQPTEIEPTPRLTRKQSKKAKKKQKAAALFSGEAGQDEEDIPAIPEAVPEAPALDEQSGPAADAERTMPGQDAEGIQPAEESKDISTPTTAIKDAPPINFGTPDFGQVAHQDNTSWHDAQSQAFANSMLKSTPTETTPGDLSRDLEPDANLDEPSTQLQDEQPSAFEPAVSKKKDKKDKKKKPPTWSDPGAEEEPSTLPAEDDKDVVGPSEDVSAGLALSAAAAAAGPAVFEAVESAKAKKKAKKDKKKKPPTWSEPDAEIDAAAEQQPVVEPQAEVEEAKSLEESVPSEDLTQQPVETIQPEGDREIARIGEETPIVEQPSESTATHQESVEEATSQPQAEVSLGKDALEDSKPLEEFVPSLSRKQSKKDKKKKKKASIWDEPAETVEGVDESASASRQLSIDDSSLAATNEPLKDSVNEPVQVTEDPVSSAAPFIEDAPIIAPVELEKQTPAADDIDSFAPVSKKKSKKDKKKARQSLDWTEQEEAPQPESTIPESTEPAITVTEAAESQAEQQEALAAVEQSNVEKEPESVPESIDTTIATGEMVPQEESAAKSALEEFAPATSKKSKKDKKKRRTFDFTEPEPEPLAESSSKAIEVEAFEPIVAEQTPEKGPDDWWNVESQPAPLEEPADSSTVSAEIIQPAETTAKSALEEFAPVSSKKKSKKDKKKKQQSFDWNEPEPESEATPLPESRDELATAEDVEKGTEAEMPLAGSTKEQDVTLDSKSNGEQETEDPTPAAESPAEAVDQELKPGLSRKQSKKDKKKKKLQLLWEPEPEPQQEAPTAAGPVAEEAAGSATMDDPASQPEDVPLPQDAEDEFFDAVQSDEKPPTAPDAVTQGNESASADTPDTAQDPKPKDAPEDLPATTDVERTEAPVEETATAFDTQQTEEPQEDYSWTPSAQKKGNKGKKSKKAISETPTTQEASSAVEQVLDVSEESKAEPLPQSWDDMVADEQATPQQVEQEISTAAPEAEAEPDFSWGPSSKKKGKKGKKSRQQSLADTTAIETGASPEPQTSTQDTVAEVEAPQSQPTAAELQSESQAAVSDEANADREANDTTTSAEREVAPEVSEATPVIEDKAETPAEGAEEDWWSFPSGSTKKKKGKKTKSPGIATPAEQEPASVESPKLGETTVPDVDQEQMTADDPSKTAEAVEPPSTGTENQDDIPVETEPQDEFSWAPSSKKKGKKGKKGKSSTPETPVVEKPDPVDDLSAHPPEVATEWQQDDADVQPNDVANDDTWTAPTSSKKKKKGKKSASGLPTAIADLIESKQTLDTPPVEKDAETVDKEMSVEQDAAEASEPGKQLDANMTDVSPAADDLSILQDASVEPFEESESPADPTFDDVWAEEDIATVEDHDAVRDLMDESRDTTDTPFISSKKGKKKKGKKASISEPKTAIEEPPVTDKAVESDSITATTEGPSSQEDPKPEEARDQPTAEAIVSGDAQDTQSPALNDEPDTNAAEFWMPQAGKKKGKKGKKGKQQSWTDEPATPVDDKKDSDQTVVGDRPTAEPESFLQESQLKNIEQDESATDATKQDNQDASVDDWLAPQAGKKKGKKGKKKQTVFESLDEPESTAALESKKADAADEDTATTILPPENSRDLQEPETDAWEAPAKGKKGKKGKKSKEVFSWEDEPTAETAGAEESALPVQAEQEPSVPQSSWEEHDNAMHDVEGSSKAEITPEEEQVDKSLGEALISETETGKAAEVEQDTVDTDRTLAPEVPDSQSEDVPTTVEQVPEPAEFEKMDTGEDPAAAQPESSKPAQEDEDFGFPVKKSKKDKKKGKKSRSSTADPWVEAAEPATPQEDERTPEKDTASGLETAAVAAMGIAAGAAIAGASKTEPEEDEWASFSSKKSKKAKKKAKKSGSSTPAFAQEDEPFEAVTDVVDFARQAHDQENNREADLELAANTDLPEIPAEEHYDLEESAQEHSTEPEPTGAQDTAAERNLGDMPEIQDATMAADADRTDTWNEATTASSPHHPSQDIDFTATVAAGLADSGFNPDMVIKDPVFHRRASPPGTVAEADPKEGFTSTTTKRKKNKKSRESPEHDQVIPAEPVASDSLAADDFDSAITRGLQGTGFDPVLLEKALASSNEGSKDVTEPEEFSFATSKRKKGKKGKKAQREEEKEAAESTATPIEDTSQTFDKTGDLQDAAVKDFASAEEPQALDMAQANQEKSAEGQLLGDASDRGPVDILTVGREEMDMDEMDRAYKAYKKNKRKQKKLKAASKAAGGESTAEETEQSAMVSENEGLSRNATLDDTLSPSTTRELATKQPADLPNDKPSAETEKATEPVQSQTSPTSVVQAAFPGLERVKRRVPPKPEPQETADSTRSPSPPRADPAFGTAGMAAVVAAAARDRKARKESEASREAPRGEPSWSFSALDDQSKQEPESPIVGSKEHQPIRDSGYQEATRSPQRIERTSREIPQILSTSSSRDSLRERRSLEPLQIPMSPEQNWEINVPKKRSKESEKRSEEARSRTPSAETPLKPTSKDRASYLFQSPPEGLASNTGKSPQPIDIKTPKQQTDNTEYFRTRSRSREAPDQPAVSSDTIRDRSTFSPPPSGPLSPRQALDSIPEEQHVAKRNHAESDVGGPDHIKAIKRTETPQDIRIREQAISPSMRPHVTIPSGSARSASNPLSTDELINRLSWPSVDEHDDTIHLDRPLGHRYSKPALPDPRSPSAMSNRSNTSGAHFKSPQELRSYSRNSNMSQGSSTHSLRRVSLSGDLRAASRRGDAASSASGARASPITIPFEPPPTPPLNDDDVVDGSASRAVDMNDDVFQGYGDAQQSQVSPTRPPSVRKRQSMHINDLESRVDQLVAENRALQEARTYAEQTNDAARDVNGQALQEALMERDLQIQEKDAEINKIKEMLLPLQEEIARLTEINGGLTEANRNLVDDTNGRYATLQREHQEAHQNWQSTSRELDTMRQEHGRITSGMKDIVEAEIATALADKNAEILRLREQLDIAAEQIRALQVQIQSSKTSDFLIQRDEDYFDGSCQKLCQHVQQWVLRFSKMSDNRVCRLSTDLNDDKIEARLDNAVLDGSDVDKLLGDRVRRRDVFMSVVMTMVWEYVFTRYLFGMDREQRQKLKALEKLLAEVGPPRAVAHWRATTLTLLSKRPSFESQCALDTEAVSHEIFSVLCRLLPPPSTSEQQLLASLTKVIRIAVHLSIEMRTQRAEYIMLPPLQPEYDTNGDLVRKVHFNASLMNERSGFFSSNEELAAEQAVVKIVLFPLVVKKGDEVGEGEEEIVVCPAQVLVQNDSGRGKKVVRVMSGAMEIDDPIRSRQSRHSLVSEAPGSVQF